MRIEQIDRERTKEHLEHVFAEIKIDRALGLWIGTCKVEDCNIAFAPKFARDLVRALANAVVTDVVLKVLRLLRNDHVDDGAHCLEVSIEHDLHGRVKRVVAEALSNLDTALASRATCRDQCVQVKAVPLGRAHVVQDQLEHIRPAARPFCRAWSAECECLPGKSSPH